MHMLAAALALVIGPPVDTSLQMHKHINEIKNLSSKLAADTLASSKTAERERNAAADAMLNGDTQVAAIHGEIAIREEKVALEMRLLAARLGGVQTVLLRAMRYNDVNKSLAGISENLKNVVEAKSFASLSSTMDTLCSSLATFNDGIQNVEATIDSFAGAQSREKEVADYLDALLRERKAKLSVPPPRISVGGASGGVGVGGAPPPLPLSSKTNDEELGKKLQQEGF